MPFAIVVKQDRFAMLFGMIVCSDGEKRARILLGEGECPAAQAEFTL